MSLLFCSSLNYQYIACTIYMQRVLWLVHYSTSCSKSEKNSKKYTKGKRKTNKNTTRVRNRSRLSILLSDSNTTATKSSKLLFSFATQHVSFVNQRQILRFFHCVILTWRHWLRRLSKLLIYVLTLWTLFTLQSMMAKVRLWLFLVSAGEELAIKHWQGEVENYWHFIFVLISQQV